MGLFRKKNNEPNQIDVLRAEIVDLKQRLDASDQQKAKLLSMVGTVDQTNSLLNQRLDSLDVAGAQLNQRIGDVDARVGNATQRIGAVDDRVSQVGQEIGEVGHRFGAVTELSGQVRALADRLEAESKKVPALPRPDLRIDALFTRIGQLADSITDHNERINAAQAALSDADVARVESEQARAVELDELSEQLRAAATSAAAVPDEVDAASAADVQVVQDQVSQMAEKMSALDNRMNKVSLELANQLTELSNDLDVLLDQADAEKEPSADDAVAVQDLVAEAIGSVQRSTEKLAAEQARYEIQFRADLAELAEHFRRPLNSNQRSTKQ